MLQKKGSIKIHAARTIASACGVPALSTELNDVQLLDILTFHQLPYANHLFCIYTF